MDREIIENSLISCIAVLTGLKDCKPLRITKFNKKVSKGMINSMLGYGLIILDEEKGIVRIQKISRRLMLIKSAPTIRRMIKEFELSVNLSANALYQNRLDAHALKLVRGDRFDRQLKVKVCGNKTVIDGGIYTSCAMDYLRYQYKANLIYSKLLEDSEAKMAYGILSGANRGRPENFNKKVVED